MTENKMLLDRVLVKPILETVTSGGIIIPENGKEKPKQGEVILVGPGKKDVEMVVKPGDIVLFSEYSGIEFKLEGEDYLIMQQDDIFMITKKK